jgi:hypothetical protein
MASLPTNTFASPGNPFYAAIGSGGGGGGGGSSLQSPASIIPAGNGSVQLGLTATGGAASSILLSGSTQNTVGFLQTGGDGYITGIVDPDGSYEISSGGAANPVLQYFGETTRNLTLGDGGTGAVFIRNALQVQDTVTSATNGINIQVTGNTTGEIYDSVATQGTLSIGSSAAFTNTLSVSDVTIPSPATANYVQINGAAGQVPLVINGAQGSGGGCGIYPKSASGITSSLNLGASLLTTGAVKIQQTGDVAFVDVGGNGGQSVRLRGVQAGASVQTGIISSDAGINGQLQFQGSSGSANSVNLTDTTCTFDQQIVQQVAGTVTYSPAIALPNATRGNGTYDFSIATYPTGLWLLMVRVNNTNITDSPTLANMFSTLLYIQQQSTPGTSVVVGGGSDGAAISNQLFATPIVTGSIGADTIRITQNTGANLYFNVKMWPLTGILPGFDS